MPWSRNTTWQQGSVLAQKDFQVVGLTDAPDADLAIALGKSVRMVRHVPPRI